MKSRRCYGSLNSTKKTINLIKMFDYQSKLETFDVKKVKYIFKTPKL